jgi:hypothetical protein
MVSGYSVQDRRGGSKDALRRGQSHSSLVVQEVGKAAEEKLEEVEITRYICTDYLAEILILDTSSLPSTF